MEFSLIIKKINNTLSEKEALEFDLWYSESEKHRTYFEKVKNNKDSEEYIFNKEKNWSSIEDKIKTTKKTNWKYYAASIALLFSISYFYNPIDKIEKTSEVIVNPVDSNKAILTLSDGKEVILSKEDTVENLIFKREGKNIAYKSSTKSEKPNLGQKVKEIEYNILTTNTGGEFSLTLEDGTKIWLNSESKLKYPVSFTKGTTREVELIYGEAYFEVSSSRNNSGDGFRVLNSLQNVSVLGTYFNIKAYPEDNEIITTLIEGKVFVENKIGEKVYLKPNGQTILNMSTLKIQQKEVEAKEEISWVRGYFNFKNLQLTEITKVLSRWYDVDISIQNKEIENLRFNGVLNKKQDIEFVLEAITNTSNITYEIKDKNIKLRK
ncbi:hypothetical protein CW731_14370 [Polaribacter sp. ALD11]|uniref:FecR family protein n=1 Tax=Polaribacter sp. ALD11 TaxID=2058137 RepID=UPI000C3175BA|nr:FecR family protein [Polaribacter sp. ALD11]AUC86391.1 hypothetical protein CW731_14370 [Polaribacter sp. ALD11]